MTDGESEIRTEARLLMKWMKRKKLLPELLDERIIDLKHQEANALANSTKYLPRLNYLLHKLSSEELRRYVRRQRKLIRRHNQDLVNEEPKKKKKRRKK